MLRLSLALSACCLVACVSVPTPSERGQAASALAGAKGWQRTDLPAGMFTLTAYLPVAVVATDTLTIYIEGDGLAWVTRDMPSADPTPRDPVGLKLALAHPGGVAVYLARPCQYVAGDDVSACQLSYWTDKRFAPEVVAATSSAVDALKSRYGARRIQLVGYSGGGAVAALVAAHRPDVTLLVTVAGNLDTQAWTEHFRATPLHGSLNPADFSGQLTHLKQVHLVAASDTVVPKLVADSYSSHFSPQRRPEVRVLEGYDHACCWEKNWPQLWNEIKD